MSGGSCNYIQHKDAETLIVENHTSDIDDVISDLKGFKNSDRAVAMMESIVADIEAVKEIIAQKAKDLQAKLDAVQSIMRQVDYYGSMDVGADAVQIEIDDYNKMSKGVLLVLSADEREMYQKQFATSSGVYAIKPGEKFRLTVEVPADEDHDVIYPVGTIGTMVRWRGHDWTGYLDCMVEIELPEGVVYTGEEYSKNTLLWPNQLEAI